MHPATIAAAYVAACTDELQALKPGNAHVHATTHKLSVGHKASVGTSPASAGAANTSPRGVGRENFAPIFGGRVTKRAGVV